ncbi:MAG TPA: AAA family ATPase, partial [Trueperaceae bacterium]|nr:AAA family ATPase [Trueperaceae bacterium]
GLTPSAATELLVSEEAARRSDAADMLAGPGPAGPGRHPRLTAPLTSFVGREAELAEVIERLRSEHCRLLTLLGPGGVGKTRLALRAAKELESHFTGGYVAIPLGLVATVEALPLALAAALGLELRGTRAPLDQLSDHLEARELLLVLDNFEHLVDGALLLQELLTSCPAVKILVTSRQRLRLQAEWLLPLAGLPTPPQLPVDTHEAELARQALTYDALELLYERARQVEPGFTITAATLPAAADICRLLEGLPLGIELAAGWLRVLSLHEVRTALESSLDSLPSEAIDSSERHRTLRVTIDHSWNLLSAGERPTFRALAVFHGSFDRTSARGVAATSLPQLTALIEKSLLRLTTAGRYDAHPIVKRYMRERLDEQPEEAARLRDAHSRYYVNMLAAWSGRLHGKQQPLMLAQFEPDYDNITAAWAAAMDSGMVAECLPAVEPLVFFHGVQGRFTEGERLFMASIERLEQHAGDLKDASVLLASLKVNRAWFLSALARFDEAVELAQEALQLAAVIGSGAVEMRGHNVLGSIASRRVDEATARGFLEKSLAVAEASNDQWGRGLGSGQLGLLELRAGHLVEAKALFESSLRINEELENTPGVVNDLDYLGRLSLAAGDTATAAAYFERGLTLAEGSRFRLRVPYLLTQLATVKLAHGEREAATAAARRALEVAEELGQRALQAEALAVLGRAGRSTDEKSSYLRRALSLSSDLGEMPRTLDLLLDIAQLPQQRVAAKTLFRLVSEHSAARPAQRDRAKSLLVGLGLDRVQPDGEQPDREQPDVAKLPTVEETVRLLLG